MKQLNHVSLKTERSNNSALGRVTGWRLKLFFIEGKERTETIKEIFLPSMCALDAVKRVLKIRGD